MKLRLFYLIAQKSIVGGALHAESVECHALAASHQYGVRTAHVLLAKRIAHVGAVDATLALYTASLTPTANTIALDHCESVAEL